METTVYVVSNCRWRDGSTVVGVGRDLSDAQVLADAPDHVEEEEMTGWAPWKPSSPSPSGRFTFWTRDALSRPGEIHPSLYQEIVKVPLTGPVS